MPVDYHAWTHLPKAQGGTDPISLPSSGLGIPDLVLMNGATTIPTNTFMPIPFEDIAYPSTTSLGTVFEAAVTDTGDAGNDRWEVSTDTKGWYAYELLTFWDQVTSGGTVEFGAAMQRMTWDTTTGFTFPDNDLRESADWMDADVHSPDWEMADNPWLHGFHFVHVPATRTWKPQARQRTGVDRGLAGITLKFWFLGADDISGWTFDTV